MAASPFFLLLFLLRKRGPQAKRMKGAGKEERRKRERDGTVTETITPVIDLWKFANKLGGIFLLVTPPLI